MTGKNNPEASDTEAPEVIRKAVRRMSFDRKRLSQDRQSTGQEPPDALLHEALRRAEAVLFAAAQPLQASEIADILPPDSDVADVLMRLKASYDDRGVNLVEVGGRWRFQTAKDLGFLFDEKKQVPKTLSQAAIETLAIIAYNQPVTRAGIENVRGVAVSKTTLDTLMDMGLIRIKGRKNAPGRPITLATTEAFLEHFGLASLNDLPGRAAFEREGLLSDNIPDTFFMPGALPENGESVPANPDSGSDTDTEAETVGRFVTDFFGDDKTG